MTGYVDLHSLPEDERIQVIGDAIMRLPAGQIVGITVDDAEKGKRYAAKLKAKFPGIDHVSTTELAKQGPLAGAMILKFQRSIINTAN